MHSDSLFQVRHAPAIAMLLIAACAASPSADYGDLELLEVSGRVTLDGVALSDARVEFESPDHTSSYGITNTMGEYRLMFNSEQSGCLPGEKVVRIGIAPAEDDAEDPDAEDTSGIIIPAAYNTNSTLRATVSASQLTFDFELTTSAVALEE